MPKILCPGCGCITTTAEKFCDTCDSNIKAVGINDQEFIESLPENQRRVMMLPIAQGIVDRMTSRPALQLMSR